MNSRPWLNHYPPNVPEQLDIPEICLYSIFTNTVNKYGNQTAIIFNEQEITYNELQNNVERLAAAWKQMGAQKGERVGLMLPNHPDYVTAYFAAHRLGLVVVQMNPMYMPREIVEILSDSEVTYLVLEERNIEKITAVQEKYNVKKLFISGDYSGTEQNNIHSIDSLISSSLPIAEKTSISVKEDVAVIQYTGGTTGKMKGAMLTHYNVVANVAQSKAFYGDEMKAGEETSLIATPLYHVYAMTSGMNLGIYLGSKLLIIDKFEIKKVLEAISKYKPTFFPGVPKMYNAFVHYPNIKEYGLDCFKICTSGSAPLPVNVIKQFEELTGATVGEGFGMSEASPTTHRNPPEGKRKVGSIGIPLPGTDCKILDDNGNELPPQSVGELLIKGPQVMKGYWKKETETYQALRDGWLYSGDLAMMDEDGYFYIVGRKKEMIIVGGFNIYPQEVESVLYDHPDVQEAAVVGIPVKDGEEIVKAYVVAKEGKSIDIDELQGHCYRNLTRYKVPKQIELRDELPRNTVGKLLKRILVEEETQKI